MTEYEFPTRKTVTIENGDWPADAVSGLPPIGSEYPSGYQVCRYDVESMPRTFWQWLTNKPRAWRVTWTLEVAK
jgi:hypothetical protein